MRSLTWAVVLVTILSSCSLVRPLKGTRAWGSEPSFVVVTPEVMTSLNTIFRITPVEFAACAEAHVAKDRNHYGVGWIVTRITFPNQVGNTKDSIESFSCAGRPGSVHSHPIQFNSYTAIATCHRSPVDMSTFWKEGWQFMIVFCNNNSYRWYTRNGEQGGVGDGNISWSIFHPK